ncbi:MAG: hypothetical protein R3C05_09505 [Pirellulaceae bacterium]
MEETSPQSCFAKLDDSADTCLLCCDTCWTGSFSTCLVAIPGVALAAAIYPVPAAFLGLMMSLDSQDLSTVDVNAFIWAIPVWLVILLMVGMLLSLLATIGTFIVMPLIILLNVSFGYSITMRTQISMVGVGTAFLFTGIPVTLVAIEGEVIAIPYGLIAVVLGHLGALQSIRWSDERRHLLTLQCEGGGRPMQIRLFHLFMATAWCAFMAAITRMVGLNFVACVVAYVLVQTTILLVDSTWRRRRAS